MIVGRNSEKLCEVFSDFGCFGRHSSGLQAID